MVTSSARLDSTRLGAETAAPGAAQGAEDQRIAAAHGDSPYDAGHWSRLVEESYDGIALTDEEGRVVEWSPALERISGLGRSEVLGRPIWDVQSQLGPPELRTPESYERLRRVVGDILCTGRVLQSPPCRGRLIVRPDGSRRVVESTVCSVRTARGHCIAAFLRDVSGDAPGAGGPWQGQLFDLVLESVADGVYTTDRSLRIVVWNRAAERITGHRAVDVMGRRCEDVLRHTDDEGKVLCGTLACPLAQALKTRLPTEREHVHSIVADGALIPMAVVAAPVLDAEGNVLGAVEAFQDVRREHEIDRIKTEIISVVSHELRTPLSSLLGFSELLLNREVPPPTQRQWLEIMHQESRRLASLLDDLLDLSRIEAGQFRLRPEPLRLQGIVENRIKFFVAQSRLHTLQAEVPDACPPVLADPDRLQIILNNLLSNAIKYSPAGGTVTVAVRQTEGYAEISVTDEGIGIPPEHLDRIFDRFHRVDSSITRDIGGTGLGLPIVKASVEMMGGRIWAESELGKGSTFRFTLPLAS